MESSYRRSRLVCFALTLLVTVIMSTTAAAQGLFGIGFPAVPSVSGFLAGRATSGEPLGRGIAAPVFYAGYMIADPRALTVGVSSPGILGTTVDVSCEYSDKGGLWLGLSQGLQLSDRVGFTASAWYLLPTDSNYEETYDIPLAGAAERGEPAGHGAGLMECWFSALPVD
jgi:hypothetical protein